MKLMGARRVAVIPRPDTLALSRADQTSHLHLTSLRCPLVDDGEQQGSATRLWYLTSRLCRLVVSDGAIDIWAGVMEPFTFASSSELRIPVAVKVLVGVA